MRTDVISTAIPEAAHDEEQESSPNTSQQRKPIEIIKSPEIVIDEATEVEQEEKVGSIRENLFIKQEENNFTEKEIREHKKSAPHNVNMQQQRAHFLFGIGSNSPSTVASSTNVNGSNINKTAVFKNGGHYAGLVTASPQNIIRDSSLKPNSNIAASLETAL